MPIIKTATLLPLHTFITIILSYSVVMFWSSSSLLLSVSTPGSTSFFFCTILKLSILSLAPYSSCPTSCLNLSMASTFFVHASIPTVASTGISKPPCMSGDRLTQKREIKVSQNAKFAQNRKIKVSRNLRTSISRN